MKQNGIRNVSLSKIQKLIQATVKVENIIIRKKNMSLTDRLYAVAKPIWDGYLEQPFVKELGEGTLREDRFPFYMVQDYRYLLQYAKVFAMGVVKTEDEALMTRFSYMVHDTLDGEMNIHKAYMSRLGITEQEVATTKSTLTNQSYTSYMLDEAYKGGETTQEIIDLVNELGKDISAEREAHLKEIFENCSRYEAMFWDMAYEEIPE